jgi:hypothetical protein
MAVIKWLSNVSNMYIIIDKDVPTSFYYNFQNKSVSNLTSDGWSVTGTPTTSANWISGNTTQALTHNIDFDWVSSLLTIKYGLIIGSHYETRVTVWWCGSYYNNYDMYNIKWDGSWVWEHARMSWTCSVTLTYNFSTWASSCVYSADTINTYNYSFTPSAWLELIHSSTSILINPWGQTLSYIDMSWS